MNRVTVNAYAKLNLSLDIVGKRADGYHLMDMVMQSVSLYDTLHIARAEKAIAFSCSEQALPQGSDNLAVCAANAFFKQPAYPAAHLSVLQKGFPPARVWRAAARTRQPF